MGAIRQEQSVGRRWVENPVRALTPPRESILPKDCSRRIGIKTRRIVRIEGPSACQKSQHDLDPRLY